MMSSLSIDRFVYSLYLGNYAAIAVLGEALSRRSLNGPDGDERHEPEAY
jgi:hypothetical protein